MKRISLLLIFLAVGNALGMEGQGSPEKCYDEYGLSPRKLTKRKRRENQDFIQDKKSRSKNILDSEIIEHSNIFEPLQISSFEGDQPSSRSLNSYSDSIILGITYHKSN